MFGYKTESGFEYARLLLSDFLTSDYFDAKEKQTSLELTEEEFKQMFFTKAFKDFLVQRERDYTLVSEWLCNESYEYTEGFGSVLDLNPGKYEVVTAFDDLFASDPVVITQYSDPLFFRKDTTVVEGRLDLLQMCERKSSSLHPILRTSNFIYGDPNEYPNLQINNFDTIFYLNNPELHRMLSLLRFGVENNVRVVTGIVTNIYDTRAPLRMEAVEEIESELKKKIGDYFETKEIITMGSAIKLIHNLK